MRVNVYAEEMTDRVEVISKVVDGNEFTAVRFWLELPVTVPRKVCERDGMVEDGVENVRGPFMHRPGDDDSSAVTFWGKKDLRAVLQKALDLLDAHAAAARLGSPVDVPGLAPIKGVAFHKAPAGAAEAMDGSPAQQITLEGRIVRAAMAVRAQGSDYKNGTHAKALWALVDRAIKGAR